MWIEILVLARAPQTAIALVVVLPGMVGLRLAQESGLPQEVFVSVAGAVSVGGMITAGQSLGRTAASHWVGRLATGGTSWWIWPKAAACATVFMAVFLLAVVAALALGVIGITDFGDLALSGTIAFCAALAAGAFLPYSESQALSPGLTAAVGVVTYAACSFAIDQVLSGANVWLSASATACVCLVLLAIYRTFASRVDLRESSFA